MMPKRLRIYGYGLLDLLLHRRRWWLVLFEISPPEAERVPLLAVSRKRSRGDEPGRASQVEVDIGNASCPCPTTMGGRGGPRWTPNGAGSPLIRVSALGAHSVALVRRAQGRILRGDGYMSGYIAAQEPTSTA